MPPIDTKRREPFKAYAHCKHCSLNVGGRCCRALLVDMDRLGARLHFFDAMSLKTVAGCRACRMTIDNVKDARLDRSLRCSVCCQDGASVVVHFDVPLSMGLVEMQKELGTGG